MKIIQIRIVLMLLLAVGFLSQAIAQNTASMIGMKDKRENGIRPIRFEVKYTQQYYKNEKKIKFRIIYTPIEVIGSTGYWYNGKFYRNEVKGLMEAIYKTKIIDPTVTIGVYRHGNISSHLSKKMLLSYTSGGFAMSDELSFDIDLGDDNGQVRSDMFSLRVEELNGVAYGGADTWATFESLIENYLNNQDKVAKVKDLKKEGDNLYSAKSFAEAKRKYTEALSVYNAAGNDYRKEMQSDVNDINNSLKAIESAEQEKSEQEAKEKQEQEAKEEENSEESKENRKSTTEKTEDSKKKEEEKDDTVPDFCMQQRFKLDDAIRRAQRLGTLEAWIEAKRMSEDIYKICMWRGISSQQVQLIDSNIERAKNTEILMGLFDSSTKNQIEGTYAWDKSGSAYSNLSYKFVLGDVDDLAFWATGIGVGRYSPPVYKITYYENIRKNAWGRDEPAEIPKELPVDGSELYLNALTYINLVAGVHGVIPIGNKIDVPFNTFNITWEVGGRLGVSFTEPSPSYVYSGHDFYPTFLPSARGVIGLELYVTPSFGIAFLGGAEYLFRKGVLDGKFEAADYTTYDFKAESTAKSLHPFVGIQINFR